MANGDVPVPTPVNGCPKTPLFSGEKTYIVGIAWLVASVGQILGYISPDQLKQIEAAMLPLGLMALRAGVTKSGPQ